MSKRKTAESRMPNLRAVRMPLDVKDERISEDKRYLALYDGKWVTGDFHMCWYGWSFHCGWVSHQITSRLSKKMDKEWERLYEIK